MFSYEQRLKTFLDKKWPLEGFKSTPHKLAISGYICKSTASDLAAQCVYCKKTLEGWEEEDIPIIEHHAHKKECILFSPNNKKDFFIHDKEKSHLSKIGFVRYDLKEGIPFIFCYKCGSTDTSHKCPITRRFKLDLLKTSDFFFINLIRGEYKDLVDLYINKKVYLPSDTKSLFRNIFKEYQNNETNLSHINKTVKEYLEEFIENKVKEIEAVFDGDIENFCNGRTV